MYSIGNDNHGGGGIKLPGEVLPTPLGEVLLSETPHLIFELPVDYLAHVGKVFQHELRVEPDKVANHMHCWDLHEIHIQ